MIELRPLFEAGLATVLNVATLRALPIACAFQASERPSLGAKTLSLAAFSIVLLLSVHVSGFDTEHTLSAYAYLLSASLILFHFGKTSPSLCAHLAVFLIAPALLWPANWLVSLLVRLRLTPRRESINCRRGRGVMPPRASSRCAGHTVRSEALNEANGAGGSSAVRRSFALLTRLAGPYPRGTR